MEFYPSNFACGDLETDPFSDWTVPEEQRIPSVFCAGLRWKGMNRIFWGDDCIRKFITECRKLPSGTVVYFHNGGNFDFHYLLPFIQPSKCEFLCIGKRIVSMRILDGVEFRDSYALVPRPLKSWEKDEIDYSLMDTLKREVHKDEIIRYLCGDLEGLESLMVAARIRNGRDFLTIASASFDKLKRAILPAKTGVTRHRFDRVFRPFYFSGRVGYFTKLGMQRGSYDVFDINSAFPRAMIEEHFWGNRYTVRGEMPEKFKGQSFVTVTCVSEGHLPLRTKDEVTYPKGEYTFNVTGWEFDAAVELDLVSRVRIHRVYIPQRLVSFADYVLPLYEEKRTGKTKADRYFSKLELNSAYGKFGQNPEYFREVVCRPYGTAMESPWTVAMDDEEHGFTFYQRPVHGPDSADEMLFNNVAVAASITGYVRAQLMRAIVECGAIYCDTDSVIVPKGKGGTLTTGDGLGEWKHEFSFGRNQLHLGGKKLYAGKGKVPGTAETVWKHASKGVRLSAKDIVRVCRGETVRYNFAAPSFSLFAGTRFISRNTRRTDLMDCE